MPIFRRLSVLISILLVFQLIVPFSITFSETSKEASKKNNDGKIKVESIDQSQESIKWRVTINDLGEENDGINTKIIFSKGLSHGTITEVENVDIEKKDEGYDIQTPAGSQAYEFEVEVGISDPSQVSYKLTTVSTYSDGEFEAFDQAVLKKEPIIEESKDVDDKEKSKSLNEKESDVKMEKTLVEEMPLENKPEDSSENEELNLQEEDSEEINSLPQSPFLTQARPNASKGIYKKSNWPNPGSLKLTKDGIPTGKYAEWEVALQIEGKDLKETSDIVLVLDKSSSMKKNNRFINMLDAATNFVNTVMADESSNARIALVEFDKDPRTLLGFQGVENKNTLLNTINGMKMGSGTNIQGGIYHARNLLAQSEADNKIILLLSDGSPNRSYKASNAVPHAWPQDRYNYALLDFDYSNRASSQNYTLKVGDTTYRINDNVIGTISEAKLAIDSGYDMYSIGLEVSSSSNAIYTIENSQNMGYYPADSDELVSVFANIANKMSKYAANEAVVTDPMGEMFNLVKDQSYNGENFEASHGTVTWDDATETFTWNVGTIKENEVYTLKYKVTIDWDKNPKGNVPYPMNGDTPLNYKDPRGHPSTEPFPIPEGAIEKGKIIKIGYRVNIDGEPIDSKGNVVSNPAEAEQFYEEFHQENDNEELLFNKTYTVTANDVRDYTLTVGENPTEIEVNPEQPIQKVWFGYVKTKDLVAGDVTAKYVDENGNEIAKKEVFTGKVGDSYTTKQKDIEGYEFVKVDELGAPEKGKFKKDPQTVIYMYKKKLGSLTVIKVDELGAPLAGAEFELRDKNGNKVGVIQTTDETGKAIFENLDWEEYKLVETKAPEGYRLLRKPINVEITANKLNVELKVENSKNGWELPESGGIGTTLFYVLGAILMIISLVFYLKKKRTGDSTLD